MQFLFCYTKVENRNDLEKVILFSNDKKIQKKALRRAFL
jgi:hypothetical protein